jgi:hypothetical protein
MTADRLSTSIVLLAGAIAGLSGAAQAQSIERRVAAASGQAALIGNESQWNHRCQWIGDPVYNFLQNPSHGSISTRREAKTIKSCLAGSCECLDHQITGLALYYTSQPGFHGKHVFNYTSKFDNGVVIAHNTTIDVK